jgi:hypothetical protein
MTTNPHPDTATAHSLWTIARIHNTLTSPVMARRFLLDITHAPAHQITGVFTAWQRVAAGIEATQTDNPSRSE